MSAKELILPEVASQLIARVEGTMPIPENEQDVDNDDKNLVEKAFLDTSTFESWDAMVDAVEVSSLRDDFYFQRIYFGQDRDGTH